jgi:hypothetical protein
MKLLLLLLLSPLSFSMEEEQKSFSHPSNLDYSSYSVPLNQKLWFANFIEEFIDEQTSLNISRQPITIKNEPHILLLMQLLIPTPNNLTEFLQTLPKNYLKLDSLLLKDAQIIVASLQHDILESKKFSWFGLFPKPIISKSYISQKSKPLKNILIQKNILSFLHDQITQLDTLPISSYQNLSTYLNLSSDIPLPENFFHEISFLTVNNHSPFVNTTLKYLDDPFSIPDSQNTYYQSFTQQESIPATPQPHPPSLKKKILLASTASLIAASTLSAFLAHNFFKNLAKSTWALITS